MDLIQHGHGFNSNFYTSIILIVSEAKNLLILQCRFFSENTFLQSYSIT